MTQLKTLFCLCLVMLPAAHTYCLEAPTVIKARKVIDLTGNIAQLKDQHSDKYLVISDGRIERISNIEPDAAEIIDLTDRWVLPGLIDTHVHITWNHDFGAPDWERRIINESTALRALRGARNAELFLQAGFTTLKEVGNDADYASADVIKAIKKGWVVGPDIIYAGKIIAPYGGQVSGISYLNKDYPLFEYIQADSIDEIRKSIRQNIFFGATAVKLVADKYSYHYSQEDIEAAVAEARASGLTISVHAMGGKAARNAILGGVDAIDHGFDLDDELLQLMKKQGTYLIGTDFAYRNFLSYGNSEKKARANSDKMVDRLRRAYKIGTPMAFGTDIVINLPDSDRVQSSLEVLETWVAANIPPEYILKTMTLYAADVLNLENDRGSLAPGMRADIIALDRNPLEDIQNVRSVSFVMKHGQVVRHDRLASRH